MTTSSLVPFKPFQSGRNKLKHALRQRYLWLALRSGTLQRVCVPPCNRSTRSSNSNKRQKKQAAVASSSCRTSPADMAQQSGLASCSLLLRISSTTTRPPVQSYLHGNDQGSSVTRRRSGDGQERCGVLSTNLQSAAAAVASAAASVAASKRCRKQALLRANGLPYCKQALLAAAWCCCGKHAYHRRQDSDRRSYKAFFVKVEPCRGRCCGAETALVA